MKIYVVANQKGGVGKSTIAVHTVYAAIERGLRVLVVDFDIQGNTSLSLGAGEGANDLLGSDLFLRHDGRRKPEKISEQLSIIRADAGLEHIEQAGDIVITNPRLKLGIGLGGDYDLCVIDTPPSLGRILRGALCASNYVLTPLQMGLFEMSGTRDLMQTIKNTRTSGLNPNLKHLGILPMKINTKSPQEMQALKDLQTDYGKLVLPFYIAERSAVKQAVAKRKPVWQGARGASHERARDEWKYACNEILNKMDL